MDWDRTVHSYPMSNIPMPNPFRKEGRPVPPPAVTSREWAKLGILAILFFFAFGTMIVFYFMSKKKPLTSVSEIPPVKEATRPSDPRGVAPPPAQDVEAKARETLRTLKDGRDKPRPDQPEFLDFLYLMIHLTPDEAAKRVQPGLSPKDLVADPAGHRGQFVRLYGRLIDLFAEPIGVTTATGTQDVYLGILQAHPSQKTVWIYLPEHPVDPATGQRIQFHTRRTDGYELITDWVEADGIFLRVYEYEGNPVGRSQGPRIAAPVVFARTLRLREAPPPRKPNLESAYLIGGAAVVLIAIVLLAGILSRKYGRRSLRMSMYDVKKDRARAEGREILPKGPPPLGEEVKKGPSGEA